MRRFVLSSVCLLIALGAAPFYPDKMNLLVYRDDAGKEHKITTAAEWAKRRAHILENMQEVMGPLPDGKRKVPLDLQFGEQVRTEKFLRMKLSFAAAEGDRVPGYLFLPPAARNRPEQDRATRLPAILCLHQTNGKLGSQEPAGLGGNPNLHYALHLAERGYITLAIDYPSFGAHPYDFKKSEFISGTMKAIWDNMRAVDLLQTFASVDPERIGCIGHSLGGHNTMFTAVFDTRIKVMVSNCGFNAFPKYYGGNLKGWSSDRYMPRILSAYEAKPEKMPFDFTEIVAAFAPRPFLASSPLHDSNFEVSGVKDCIAAAGPVYELFGARQKLAANYPDCKHDFPADVREVAYQWMDRWLR